MKRTRILITGVGGQGTLLASSLLGNAAMAEGIPVLVSEVHGMAQRGGVVESTVMLGGLESPIISRAEADILVSFEPLETLRALDRCSSGTVIITNTSTIVPFTVELGQAQYPDTDKWISVLRDKFRKVIAYDARALAGRAGTPRALNVVLLGTLIGTGVLPVSPERMKETIRKKVQAKFVEANLQAFELGMKEAA